MSEDKISRRSFLKSVGALAFAASPLGGLLSSCKVGEERSQHLTILHTNDVHSHIDPFPEDDPRYHGLGGYARRQSLIDNTIAKVGADNVMVFESGDMFQGTPYFNYYRGMLEMQLMNRMHVDGVTIGNHEFDNGVESLCKCMEAANFPFINANYDITDSRARGLVKPYKIFERGGMRVGVFGLGVKLAGLVGPRNCKGFTYNDPVDVARDMSKKLRNEGCDLVIALTHIGHEMYDQIDDVTLAKTDVDIDLILGGHSHTFLPNAVHVKNANGKDIVINQVGFGGINVGVLELSKAGSCLVSSNNKTMG